MAAFFRSAGIVLAAGALCVIASGCGQKSAGSDDLVLKAGFSTNESDPRVVATKLFKEEVEKGTDGRITIEIHPDGELGSDADLISGVVNGNVDITASSAGNFSSYAKNVGVSAFPFLFEGFDSAWEFVDGEVELEAEKEFADCNIHVLGHYDNGFRCVTTSEKVGPVESVEDMNGLVIRTPENQIVMETMLLLRAEPRVLEFTKLYDALKSGEFDAQENPVPVIYNNKLYEVQKNLAITNHSYDVMPFVIRLDVWESLSDEDKAVLEKAALNAQKKDRELIRSQTEELIEKLKEEGMNVTYPDLEEFKAATSSIYDSFGNEFDQDILNKVRK